MNNGGTGIGWRAKRSLVLLSVLLIVACAIAVVWRIDNSTSHLRNIPLSESQPRSYLLGPPSGSNQLLLAESVNISDADAPKSWKVFKDAGFTVLPNGRDDILGSCLDASVAGVGVLSGTSLSHNEPRVYTSDTYTAPNGPTVGSRLVQVPSPSVEQSDLTRYSSRALSPCMSQWKQAPFLNVPQAPTYDPFAAPRVAGVQAIGFHFRYQLGGSGSPTNQYYGDLLVAGSGRLEGTIYFLSSYVVGFGGPIRSLDGTERHMIERFMTRMAAAAH